MLSKVAWWVLTKRDCLCVNILVSQYKVINNWRQPTLLGHGEALGGKRNYYLKEPLCWEWEQHPTLGRPLGLGY
jgi:hypothetical protein